MVKGLWLGGLKISIHQTTEGIRVLLRDKSSLTRCPVLIDARTFEVGRADISVVDQEAVALLTWRSSEGAEPMTLLTYGSLKQAQAAAHKLGTSVGAIIKAVTRRSASDKSGTGQGRSGGMGWPAATAIIVAAFSIGAVMVTGLLTYGGKVGASPCDAKTAAARVQGPESPLSPNNPAAVALLKGLAALVPSPAQKMDAGDVEKARQASGNGGATGTAPGKPAEVTHKPLSGVFVPLD